TRRGCRPRPRHRAVDRRPPRRRHPSGEAGAARLPHGRHPSAQLTRTPEETPMSLATIDEALKRIRRGEMVLVVDDEDRENEGDLTMAACWVTGEAINFMLRWARGLVCMPCDSGRLDELDMWPMVPSDRAGNDTAVTVSIDHVTAGSGIGAGDRATTFRRILAPGARPSDFQRPGHVFPLRARPGGVLERRGHTEAAVDLARLAGSIPAGVICEIVNDDGTMARVPDLVRFCAKHGLTMITVADLARYRLDADFDDSLSVSSGLFSV